MANYELKDLVEWDARIRDKVAEFGLDCFPQEFEICDHYRMLGYMAYSGMPSHYPHWSYGKSYEKLKTLYDYGVCGLPYEMVINSNPALAYLMRDNSLLLQILTIAHVYGHNDFFKNNFTFAPPAPRSPSSCSRRTRSACAVTPRTPPSASRRSSTCSTPRMRCAGSAAATSRSASSATTSSSNAWWTRLSPRPIRSKHPCARGSPRARPPQGAARARRGPPAVHPRPQPVPRRVGKGPAHDRARGSAVLHAADRNQDHERGMGDLLAQAHPRVARISTGPAARVHRAPQPGGAPDSRPDQPLPPRVQRLGRHPPPPHQSDARGDQARRPADQERRSQKIFEVREADRDVSFLRRYPDRGTDARDGPVRVRGARRRSGGRQGRRRRRLARGQGNAASATSAPARSR